MANRVQSINIFKTFYQDILTHRSFYLILLLLTILMALMLNNTKQGADGTEYLRWTHSFVFDRDLHLLNNFEAIGGSYSLTPTGYVFERVNIGAPLLWTPFFGVASYFLPTSSEPNKRFYPTIQLLWINFSSWLYTILAGILTIGPLRRLFPVRTLSFATLAILLGTPVLFYMAIFSLSSHAGSIFLAALVLYLWISKKKPYPWLHYLSIGLVLGWMVLVASYNIALFLLPGFDLLSVYAGNKNWRQLLINGLAVGLGGFIGFVPQMIAWWFLFGGPFSTPYLGQLNWTDPFFIEVLFSSFHGLFLYAPVLLLVIPGLWWWARRNSWQALGIGLSWLFFSYIISASVAWWAGSSLGNRYFLSLTPFFIFGLAAFLHRGGRWAGVLVGLAVLWTIGLYLQFLNGVRLTSDSIVFSPLEIAQGQISALTNVSTIVPNLFVNVWANVSIMSLLFFILLLGTTSRLLYGWVVIEADKNPLLIRWIIVVGGVGLVLFVALAGWNSERAKAVLTDQGFYDQEHQSTRFDTRELANNFVQRAAYYEQTGHPELAQADLRAASELWKRDANPTPTRLYLGPKSEGCCCPF